MVVQTKKTIKGTEFNQYKAIINTLTYNRARVNVGQHQSLLNYKGSLMDLYTVWYGFIPDKDCTKIDALFSSFEKNMLYARRILKNRGTRNNKYFGEAGKCLNIIDRYLILLSSKTEFELIEDKEVFKEEKQEKKKK